MKMKKYIYGLAASLALGAGALSTSCIRDYFEVEADNEHGFHEPYIELTFDTGMGTRAEENNDFEFSTNEKKMNTVDLFFYAPDPNVDTSTPVKVHHIDNTTHNTKHTVTLSDADVKVLFGNSGTVPCRVYAVVNVDDAAYTAADVTKTTATIEQLRKIKASTPTFATEKDFQGGFAMFTAAKDGDQVSYSAAERKATGTIKVKNLAAKIDLFVTFGENGEIQGVDPNSPGTDSKTWKVVQNKDKTPTAEVHIVNGVTAVVLNGLDKSALTDDDYYSIRYESKYVRGVKGSTEYPEYPWVTSSPYYTYPNSWEITPLEQHRTTLLLKVDWITSDGTYDGDELTTYYSVPLNLEGDALESNKYYRVKVNINTLGGQNFGEPLELEGSWEVLDWCTAELEADIRELRYLEVSQKQLDRDGELYTAVINGSDGLVTIPFLSSHKAVIRSVKVEYYSYDEFTDEGKEGDRNWKVIYPGIRHEDTLDTAKFIKTQQELKSNDWHCAYIDNVNHTISVKHNIGATALNSSQNYYYPDKGKDNINTYYSYLITIVLQHEDSDQHFELETITIIHHPSVYVEGEINTVINNSFNATSRPDPATDRFGGDFLGIGTKVYYGWVRVNNNNPEADDYGGVKGIAKNDGALGNLGDRSSRNPVMYIINVTQLDEGSIYHIRDPRVTTNEANNIGGNWTSAPHYVNGAFDVTGNSHKLTNYYPTNESMVDEVKYALSPRYRVSSSFGQTERRNGLNNNPKEIGRADAKRRCASYCEFGYPAGRWRLPTLGEMKFIQELSNKGLIPRIFNVNVDYICAQGIFKFDSNGNETENVGAENAYVRCVYDDWYWVKDDGTPDKIADPYNALPSNQIFVWGDKPKNNPQVQPTE